MKGSTVAAPERSLQQRLDALNRANDIRTKRAQIKRDLKARRVAIRDLLLDPPECLETAKVFDMLMAVPRCGRVKANKILLECRVSPSKTFAGLSARQRKELAIWAPATAGEFREPFAPATEEEVRAARDFACVSRGWDAWDRLDPIVKRRYIKVLRSQAA